MFQPTRPGERRRSRSDRSGRGPGVIIAGGDSAEVEAIQETLQEFRKEVARRWRGGFGMAVGGWTDRARSGMSV